MPLIIAVLVIIVVFMSAGASGKEADRKRRQYTAAIRKTNAVLEYELVKKYMDDGLSLDEAIESAQSDLLGSGFEPCIPKTDWHQRLTYSEYIVDDVERHDSDAVRHLREQFRIETKHSGIKFSDNEEFKKKCNKYVYDNMPETQWQYEQQLVLSRKRLQAVAVGRYISVTGFGTCEVIALDYNKLLHTVKVLKTGQIIKIPFGDKRIIQL